MMRNFQKGLAILLILCLLVNGAAGHEQTIPPELQKAFDEFRMLCATETVPFDWHLVTGTKDDTKWVVVSGDFIGVPSLGIYGDVVDKVYYCEGYDRDSEGLLVYGASSGLWYDSREGLYLRVSDGWAFRPPYTDGGHGYYAVLDDADRVDYERITGKALSSIQKFNEAVGDLGRELIKKTAERGKLVKSWSIHWNQPYQNL